MIDDINIIVEEKMSVCGLVVTGVMASIQFCWLSEASSGRWTGVSRMAVLRGTRILHLFYEHVVKNGTDVSFRFFAVVVCLERDREVVGKLAYH